MSTSREEMVRGWYNRITYLWFAKYWIFFCFAIFLFKEFIPRIKYENIWHTKLSCKPVRTKYHTKWYFTTKIVTIWNPNKICFECFRQIRAMINSKPNFPILAWNNVGIIQTYLREKTKCRHFCLDVVCRLMNWW